MKKSKILKMLFALFLGIGLFLGTDQEVDAGVGDTIAQTFPDPNMAQAIANNIASGNVNTVITSSMVSGYQTRVLDLSDSNITDITGISVFGDSLVQLYLHNNQITTLSAEIGDLGPLQLIGINNNSLTTFPDSIGNLYGLHYLYAENNQITNLPDTILNLNLRNFTLANNNLIDLPTEKYNFVISSQWYYTLSNQTYSQAVSEQGFVNNNFAFYGLPAQEQFTNYGMTFAFTLIKPDGTSASVIPTIEDGKVTLDATDITQVGNYTLVTDGTGGSLDPVRYEQRFSIIESTPVLTLIGDSSLTVIKGLEFEEPGFSAIDDADGDITEQVVVSGSVDTTQVGSNTLTYTVTNTSGNTVSVEREVIVVEDSIVDDESKDVDKEESSLPNTGNNSLFTIIIIALIAMVSLGSYALTNKK